MCLHSTRQHNKRWEQGELGAGAGTGTGKAKQAKGKGKCLVGERKGEGRGGLIGEKQLPCQSNGTMPKTHFL